MVCLLITFANSLKPDQAQQYVRPDLDPNCMTLMVFLKELFYKVDFEKKSADDNKSMKNYPVGKMLMILVYAQLKFWVNG